MLKIPQAIKDLFKTDGILKNIRISFPYGEYADICNDRIIKESLKFDESISSREEIKFGLCESSQLSFECVDVENIKGLEIAADIEIDATGIDSDIAPTDVHEPVIICATPEGEEEEKFFVIFDFPELSDGETYLSSDNVDIAWKGSLVDDVARIRTYDDEHMPKLSQYRQITGVDPRGTSEDTYDGLQGGGFLRTYVYSVTTGKFYSLLRMEFEYEEDILPFSIQYGTAFENDEFLKIINHIYLDAESREYMYPVETQTSPDVPFPFYRVPLGHFIVDECKRDASMKRRKVVAYSDFSFWSFGDSTEYLMGARGFTGDAVRLNIMNYLLAGNPMGLYDTDFEVTSIDISDIFYDDVNYTIASFEAGESAGIPVYVDIDVTKIWEYNSGNFAFPNGDVMGRINHYGMRSDLQADINYCVAHFVYPNSDTYKLRAEIRKALNNLCGFSPVFIWLRRGHGYGNYSGNNVFESDFAIADGGYFVMPYQLEMPVEIKLTAYMDVAGRTVVLQTYTISDIVSRENIDMSTIITPYSLRIDFIPTEVVTSDYSFYPAFKELTASDMLNDCVELFGAFGKIDRNGKFILFKFAEAEFDGLFPNKDIYPQRTLYPAEWGAISADTSAVAIINESEMMSLWYEEYAIQFDGIVYSYFSSEILDEDNEPTEITTTIIWNEAAEKRIYNITNNEVIKGNSFTSAQINTLLRPLIQALKTLKFYPSDLQSVGLPYIEAGDWVLASYRGNQILGLILSRTLDGIQALRDKMKSD